MKRDFLPAGITAALCIGSIYGVKYELAHLDGFWNYLLIPVFGFLALFFLIVFFISLRMGFKFYGEHKSEKQQAMIDKAYQEAHEKAEAQREQVALLNARKAETLRSRLESDPAPAKSAPSAHSFSINFDFPGFSDDEEDDEPCDARPKNLKTAHELKRFKDYVVLDVETTGLSRSTDSIIEIGMIKVQNNEEVDRFSALVNPGIPIPSEATQVSGITDQDVQEAPRIAELAKSIAAFIGNDFVVGHNVSFDLAFLLRECGDAFTQSYIYYVDTIGLAKRAFPLLGDYKLATLVQNLGIAQGQSHRAMGDAECTAQLLKLCIEKMLADYDTVELAHKQQKATQMEQSKGSPLYQMKFVFTGEFATFERSRCEFILAEVGALHRTAVSKQTDYLVVGQNDGVQSVKQKKAAELAAQGHKIQIINETEFLAMVNNARQVLGLDGRA